MDLTKEVLNKALNLLNESIGKSLNKTITITIGGGGALILGHAYDGATKDLDGVSRDMESIKEISEQIAKIINIEHDWLNPYFSAFTYYLPADSNSRIIQVYKNDYLIVYSLGVEDLLIMKYMAGRPKDLKHIRHLLLLKPDLNIIEERLIELCKIKKDEAENALELFYEHTDKD